MEPAVVAVDESEGARPAVRGTGVGRVATAAAQQQAGAEDQDGESFFGGGWEGFFGAAGVGMERPPFQGAWRCVPRGSGPPPVFR